MQWGNVGNQLLVYIPKTRINWSTLMMKIVEPLRSVLIPGFDLVKQTALEN
jgi:homoserine kinase